MLVNFSRKLPLHEISVPKGSAQEFDALSMCGEIVITSPNVVHLTICTAEDVIAIWGVSLLTGSRLEFSPDSLRSSSVSRAELPPAVPLKRFFQGLIRRADHPKTPSRSRRDAMTLGLRKVRHVVPMRKEPASVGLLALRLPLLNFTDRPILVFRAVIIALREIKSNAPTPSIDNTVALVSLSVALCTMCAMLSHPLLLIKRLAIRRRTTSPTTMPQTPPLGFSRAVN